MDQIKLIFFMITLFIYSCAEDRLCPIVHISEAEKGQRINLKIKKRANYNLLYIGEEINCITYHDSLYFYNQFRATKTWSVRSMEVNDSLVSIYIDTTQIIPNPYSEYIRHEDSTFFSHHSLRHPVALKNTSTAFLEIGYGNYIRMIAEAKNENGKWIPLERYYGYACGTGILNMTLYPNEMCVTSLPIYEGDFQTKVRLRLGEALSNSIDAWVNKSQLDTTLFKRM